MFVLMSSFTQEYFLASSVDMVPDLASNMWSHKSKWSSVPKTNLPKIEIVFTF